MGIATTNSSISTSASCLHMLLSLVRKSHSKSYLKSNNAILRRNLFPPFFYCFVVCQKRHNGWCRINTLDTKNTHIQTNDSVPNLSQTNHLRWAVRLLAIKCPKTTLFAHILNGHIRFCSSYGKQKVICENTNCSIATILNKLSVRLAQHIVGVITKVFE